MTKPTTVLSHYPDYEVVIGIEVHVQLNTKSKIFCSCANEAATDPNKNICDICAGYPGSLPLINRQVIDYAILAGTATHCDIASHCAFDRKHYFYPDLPKNYQITQAYSPICTEGHVPIRREDGSIKKVRLNRIHIEEDAGKNIHADGSNESFVDLNRAGTPLLEVVTYPDLSNAYEVKAYLRELRLTMQYLGICSGNMEEGAFRADTNISVRKKGDPKLGTKCELKNINSFKFIGDAIEYEIERQIELIESGGKVRQETRLWNVKRGETVTMRSKEEAADYRYFQDPDLPLIEISPEHKARVAEQLPERPFEKFERLCNEVDLTPAEAEIMVDDMPLARYFEQAMTHTKSKQLINWLLRNVLGHIKEHGITLDACLMTPQRLAQLVDLIDNGTINTRAAQEVFAVVAQSGKEPASVVKELGLEQIGSSDELDAIIKELVAAHPEAAADYRAGKHKLFGFFVGQAMQKTKGKGNPQIIQELLKKYLA